MDNEKESRLPFLATADKSPCASNSSESLLLEDISNAHSRRRVWGTRSRGVFPWILHLILLSISGGMLLLSASFQVDTSTRTCPSSKSESKFRKSRTRSPEPDIQARVTLLTLIIFTASVLGTEPETYTSVRFDGSFDRSSPFKGPPSPAIDAAWDEVIPREPVESPFLFQIH